MRKNKLTVVKRPRLYSNGGGFDFSLLQKIPQQGDSQAAASNFGNMLDPIDNTVQDVSNMIRMFNPRQEDPHLVSRRALRGYDLGGYLELAGTAVKQVTEGIKGINDVNDKAKTIEEDIKGQNMNITPSSSTEELLNKWSSWHPTDHITWKDLTNKGTAASYISDSLSMSSEGASAGFKASGNWIGAVAGGVGGLFSGIFGNLAAKIQAKKRAEKINDRIDSQNANAQRALIGQAEQLDDTMVAKELSDFTGWEAAYGGPLFADGGRIYIKPKNRGKFTETKRRTGKTTEELTHSSNPLTRKRAIFAQNAKKWHHAFGGDLMTQGADFDTGLTLVGNGGTHEENPNEGVQMGVDAQGIPNLVEEGEVIFNDYVFSKRLKVPKEVKKKYKLGGLKSLSFADAALKIGKESEERPNDPISQLGLKDGLSKLMVVQEQLRQKNSKTDTQYAKGGKLGTVYAGLDTDPYPNILLREDLPYLGEGWAAIPQIKEGRATIDPGESALKEIARRKSVKGLPIPEDTPLMYPNNPTFMNGITYVNPSSDPLNLVRYNTVLPEVLINQQSTGISQEARDKFNDAARTSSKRKKGHEDPLRYAPLISQGSQYLSDLLGLTNRPEYTLGRRIREANNQIRGISTRAAGQKVGYRPADMWAAINNLNAQTAAQRSAIRNSGNRVGSVGQQLALAYGQNRALGDLLADMETNNWNRYMQSVTHNTGVDQADRAAELQAAQMDAAQGNIRAQNYINAAKADDAEEAAYAQARAANKDKFYNNLGVLGKENIDRAMLTGMIESGLMGTPNEAMLVALARLGVHPDISKIPKTAGETNQAARGGRINRKKKRRGLTY